MEVMSEEVRESREEELRGGEELTMSSPGWLEEHEEEVSRNPQSPDSVFLAEAELLLTADSERRL